MTFTSSFFLLGILPLFVLLYRWGGKKPGVRKALLLVTDVLFLIWGGVGAFLVLLAYIVLAWGWTALVSRAGKKWVFALAVAAETAPLVAIKYTAFLTDTLNAVLGCSLAAPSLIVPLGISFVTFQALSLLADVRKGRIQGAPNLLQVCLYLTFFPTVTSGPILRYQEFLAGLNQEAGPGDLSAGMERILIGLCKKVLVADKIAALTEYYFTGVGLGNSFSVPGLWIGSVAYSLQLYYDFSGYSDMAVGIGQLLGFRIRENFNRPYLAGSLTEFWRRWHMSLTQWFRDYVYIPLGGNRCAPARHLFNMLVVWLLTGLWHGAGWTFVLWGLGYFVLLSAEKYLPLPQGKGGKLLGHIYTLIFVNLLWVLFRSPSLAVFGRYVAGMFGGGSGALEYKALRFIPLLALAAVLCLPWGRWLSGFSGKKWFSILRGLLLLILLVLALSAVVNASYVPYIYGNF